MQMFHVIGSMFRILPMCLTLHLSTRSELKSTGMDVNVITHKRQRYAVWFGGSLMASTVSSQLKQLWGTRRNS